MIRNECSAAWTMFAISNKHLCPFNVLCFPRIVTAIPKPVNELMDLAVTEDKLPHPPLVSGLFTGILVSNGCAAVPLS